MVRLPKNFSNTFGGDKSSLKTGANVLDAEIVAEQAYALGLAGRQLEKALHSLNLATQNQQNRELLVQHAADRAHAYFVQRELIGLHLHDDVIKDYNIPKDVLSRVGCKPNNNSE